MIYRSIMASSRNVDRVLSDLHLIYVYWFDLVCPDLRSAWDDMEVSINYYLLERCCYSVPLYSLWPFQSVDINLLFDSIAAISCRMYVNSTSFDIWTPASVPREYIYMFVTWLKFLFRRYIFWSTFVFFCSLSLMKFSVIEILCTSRLRMDSLRVFWSFLWRSSQILFYGFLLRGRNTEDFIGKVLIIICTLCQSGREVIESHERYEGKFCDCVLCPPDLCHAGCARLAGQKMSNKKKFFVSEGRWHGEFARLSLLACVSFFSFPFCFHLFASFHYVQIGYYSTLSKDPLPWPLNGFLLY